MIFSGHLLLPTADASVTRAGESVRLTPGWVRVEDGRLAEVREGALHARPDAGGEACVIAPGFIDAHLHLPQFDSIGASGMTLLEWLDRVIFPAEARWADAAYAANMGARVARQLLAHGTTSIAAYATVHHEGTIAAIEALAAAGVRGAVGQVLMERNAPPELCRPRERLLAEAAALCERYPAFGKPGAKGIEHAVSPRFAVSCDDDLLRGAGTLALRAGAMVQTHLAEMVPECELVEGLFGGKTYTQVYDDAGLLTGRTILGHGIYLSGHDRQTLARAGCVVAHCPAANDFLQSGAMNLGALERSGVAVALGSDIAGGFERSMARVCRAMMHTQARRAWWGEPLPERARTTNDGGHEEVPSAARAWWMATAGNARACGWTDRGELREGLSADVLVIEPDIAWQGAADPLSTILHAWDDRWLKHTLALGRVVYAA
ncbi:MAG: amidohydrolase family protein [Phycisphaerales bacterium]